VGNYSENTCAHTQLSWKINWNFRKFNGAVFFEHKQIVFGFIHSGTTNKYLGIKSLSFLYYLKYFRMLKHIFPFLFLGIYKSF